MFYPLQKRCLAHLFFLTSCTLFHTPESVARPLTPPQTKLSWSAATAAVVLPPIVTFSGPGVPAGAYTDIAAIGGGNNNPNLDIAGVNGKTLRIAFNNASSTGAAGGTPNYYIGSDTGEDFLTIFNNGSGSWDPTDKLTISFTDNSHFSFTALDFFDWLGSSTITVKGFNGVAEVASTTITGNNSYAFQAESLPADFGNVTRVEITTNEGLYYHFDNFVIGDPIIPCTQIVAGDIPVGNAGPFNKTIGGYTFTFTPAADNYVDIESEPGLDGLYALDYNSPTSSGIEFTISAPNGYTFDLNSFAYYSSQPEIEITLTFGDGTTSVETYTVSGGSAQTFSAFSPAANDVKSVKIVADEYGVFNTFCISDIKPYTPLPLELLSFTWKKAAAGVTLLWETTSETNTEAFDVERSVNGGAYTIIGSVPAANAASTYSYTDNSGEPGKSNCLYRLKMRDQDGSFIYSHVLSVPPGAQTAGFVLYPNPAAGRDVLYLRTVNADLAGASLQINIVDITGRLCSTLQAGRKSGNLEIPVKNLAPGTYMLQVRDNKKGVLQVIRFTK